MKTKIKKWIIIPLLTCILIIAYATPTKAQYVPDAYTVGLWHLDKEFGTALSFDGIDDYVELASNSSIMPGILTVEAWIKPDKTGARQSLVSKWDGYGYASYSLELTSTNKFLFYLHDGTTTQSITGTTVITLGTWYHVAGTYDSTEARLYVNGVLEAGPTPLVAPMITSSVPLKIGASSYYPPDYGPYTPFKGVIDEVRISNVARASFDLTGPLTDDSNTVALWHFDEGSGQTAGDAIGANDAQLGSTSGGDDNDPAWTDTTLAPDTSSNNNFGTIYGATWTTGAFDGALSFDGDDYVEVAHSTSLDVSDSYTFEAWVYLTDDSDYRGLFRRGTRGVKASEIEIYIHPDWAVRKLVVAHNREGDFCYRYFTVFPLNQWIYLTVTWDGTTVRAYYNAIEQISISGLVMVNPAVSDKPSFIGLGYYAAYTPGNTPYMIGDIDEVRISNVVRAPGVQVYIDIKPGSYPNAINLGSRGSIPVAILSSEDFDATTVDPETVELAGAGVAVRGKSNKYMAHVEDVNGDGLLDLVVQVDTENFDPDSNQDGIAVLTGTTYGGTAIEGSDEIIIVPKE